MEPSQVEQVEAALAISWNDFRREHPAQAQAIEDRLEEPVITFASRCLQEDPELLAQTEAETNIGNIVKAILPLAINLAFKLIGGT